MSNICFYFQVHQPQRVKNYRIFDIGHDHEYFNDQSEKDLNNAKVLRKVSSKSYLPANRKIFELLKRYPAFRVTFSISGVALEQFEKYAPEVIESFTRLVETGRVELLAETYYHSLASIKSKKEFERQVVHHSEKIFDLFGVVPEIFRNTELIYSNDIAENVSAMGYKAMLMEGADHILNWRSPNFIYKSNAKYPIKLLLKNYRLSDDIAFRFSERSWVDYPLTADKFSQWIDKAAADSDIVNLFMDYETFGEHQWEDTGIFHFLDALPGEILKNPDNNFITPSEAVRYLSPVGEIDSPNYVSWADVERDLSAWLSNPMQHDALKKIYDMETDILSTKNEKLISDWRKLQTSDHFYYMCTKWFRDGDVHAYFNPYESPYDAFISYMNVLADMKLRIDEAPKYLTWPGIVKKLKEVLKY